MRLKPTGRYSQTVKVFSKSQDEIQGQHKIQVIKTLLIKHVAVKSAKAHQTQDGHESDLWFSSRLIIC